MNDLHYESLFIKENMEKIQLMIKNHLQIEVSLLFHPYKLNLKDLEIQFNYMKNILYYKVNTGAALITSELIIGKTETNVHKFYDKLKRVDDLKIYFEHGKKKEFFDLLDTFTDYLNESQEKNNMKAVEIYNSIALIYISFINKTNIFNKMSEKINLKPLMRFDLFETIGHANKYLYQVAEHIFECRKDEQKDESFILSENIKKYIVLNIGNEITLDNIAKHVRYNPSYVSRLFKQMTGRNLFEYINSVKMEKAKELLLDNDKKLTVATIAKMLGYETSQYFCTVFKKFYSATPAEFREMNLN